MALESQRLGQRQATVSSDLGAEGAQVFFLSGPKGQILTLFLGTPAFLHQIHLRWLSSKADPASFEGQGAD